MTQLSDEVVGWFRRLLCRLGSHRYYIIARLGIETCHVGCADCSRTWGMHRGVHAFLPWDADLADFHREAHGYEAKGQS